MIVHYERTGRTGRMFRGGEAQVSTKSDDLSTIKFFVDGFKKTVKMTRDPLELPLDVPLGHLI